MLLNETINEIWQNSTSKSKFYRFFTKIPSNFSNSITEFQVRNSVIIAIFGIIVIRTFIIHYVIIHNYYYTIIYNFYRSLHPVKYYRDYLAHNIRPDGRDLDKFRPLLLNIGTISTANGSAIVKIGKTTVVCGIKAVTFKCYIQFCNAFFLNFFLVFQELCAPKPEKANEGFLIPNVELPPLCSSKFRPGPPSDQAQVLSKLIFDVIKNSECVKLEELCITKEKLAWCLYADLICLDYDGALIDACVTALMAALKTVKLPQVQHDPVTDSKEVDENERLPINVYSIPICTTFATFEE